MSLYDLLGVGIHALHDELRSAYRRRALAVHPDKGGSKECFQAVMNAFETLCDPTKRGKYDASLARASARREGQTGDQCSRKRRGQRENPLQPSCSTQQACHPSSCDTHTAKPFAKLAIFKAPSAKRVVKPSAVQPPIANIVRPGEQPTDWCSQIHIFLSRLRPDLRRQVFQERFSQTQRRALECWMLKQKSEKKAESALTNEALMVFSHEESISSNEDDASASCNSDSSESGVSIEVAVHPAIADIDVGCERKSCGGAAREDAGSDSFGSTRDGFESMLNSPFLSLRNGHGNAVAAHDCAYGDQGESRPKSHPKDGGSSRGIQRMCWHYKGRTTVGYRARVTVDGLQFSTRITHDLAQAVDFHVALMGIKQHIHECEPSALAVEQAVIDSVKEHGLDPVKDLKLSVAVVLQTTFFIRSTIQTPMWPFRKLRESLNTWMAVGGPSGMRQCGGLNMYQWHSPVALAERWGAICKECERCWASHGRDPQAIAAWLETKFEENLPYREQQLEAWNRWRLAREEQRTQRASRFESVLRCKAARAERSQLHRERRAMSRASKESMHVERLLKHRERRLEADEKRVLGHVYKLLRRWARAETRQNRQMACEARAKRMADRRSQELSARDMHKRMKMEREARWRWMNRRDITMDEMLGSMV